MVVAKLTAHRLLPVAGLLALLVFTWWLRPAYSGGLLYKWAREAGRRQAWFLTRGLRSRESPHFLVRYRPEDEEVVSLVVEAAEFFYMPLSLRLGYTPANKILLILYPDRQSLRNVFGWPDGEDALGVYWGGVIRILSPRAWDWLEPDRSLAEEFMSNGPLAHELTHYFLDYLTGGNYPRWFSEGLAQYEEYILTGYQWVEPGSDNVIYSLDDLELRFDRLPAQPAAYRRAFLLVSYIASRYGDEKLREIVRELARGKTFDEALQRSLGLTRHELQEGFAAGVRE